jgi:hypothetical protein
VTLAVGSIVVLWDPALNEIRPALNEISHQHLDAESI